MTQEKLTPAGTGVVVKPTSTSGTTDDSAASPYEQRTNNATPSAPTHDQESDRRPFVCRWRSAILNSDRKAVPSKLRVVLLATAEFADSEGRNCNPAIPSIATLAGLNEKLVRRLLVDAEAAGWIVRHQHHVKGQAWRRYGYELRLPSDADIRNARSRFRRAATGPAPLEEGAATGPAGPAGRCGQNDENVRAFPQEGAATGPDELGKTIKSENEKRIKDPPGASAGPILDDPEFVKLDSGECEQRDRLLHLWSQISAAAIDRCEIALLGQCLLGFGEPRIEQAMRSMIETAPPERRTGAALLALICDEALPELQP